MAETTPELKTYKGSCHCNAFKFTVKMPEIKGVMECNCSICFGLGLMWVFPSNGLVVKKGEEVLKGYEFGGKSMEFKFCGICGTSVYGKRHGAPEGQNLGLNARTLQDLNLSSLDIMKYDGKKLPPPYEPVTYKGPEPTAKIEDAKIYTGSCHCGAVTLAMKVKGELTAESIGDVHESEGGVSKTGAILANPLSEQIHIENKEGLSSYIVDAIKRSLEFCSKCGMSVYLRKLDVTDEQWEKIAGKEKNKEEAMKRCAVNLKCFWGVEWENVEVTG